MNNKRIVKMIVNIHFRHNFIFSLSTCLNSIKNKRTIFILRFEVVDDRILFFRST